MSLARATTPRRLTRRIVAGSLATTLAASVLTVHGAVAAPASASVACSWLDASKTPQARADEFVAAATDLEKIALTGATFTYGLWFGSGGHIAANPRLCFPGITLQDASSGVAGIVGGVTAFPTEIAQASTWDRALEEQYGRVLGSEHRAKAVTTVLAPSVNTTRNPLGGRVFEYFGEDPLLSGQMGAAMSRGIASQGLVTQIKHFAFNAQETGRGALPGEKVFDHVIDERTMRETDLAAFETAIKQGDVGSVMCAYNKVNGIDACENSWLLNTVLKREWGFDGYVGSDWGAARSERTIAAGMDMENTFVVTRHLGLSLLPRYLAGQVSKARLDDMVRRIVLPMFRAGQFDRPTVNPVLAWPADVSTRGNRAFARRMAAEGTVLLKNAGGLLPLQAAGKRIAVLGTGAVNPGGIALPGVLAVLPGLKDLVARPYTGGGSSAVSTLNPIYPCDAMKAAAVGVGASVVCDPTTDPAAAAKVAAGADIAVVFAWKPGSEGTDIADYDLPDTKLIDAVSRANPRTVVYLQTGNAVSMPWLDRVPAVLEGWIGGQEFGNGFVDVLLGRAEPGGRLPISFPKDAATSWIRSAAQAPGVDDTVTYSEALNYGYRYYNATGVEPQFPFGHGLSYTTWRHSDLAVTPTASGARVGVTVANTGARAGSDVVQVYVTYPSAAGEPPRQLRGFAKVRLAAGASKAVTVSLDKRAFQIWDTARSRWTTVPGCYDVFVGRSSTDLQPAGRVARGGGTC